MHFAYNITKRGRDSVPRRSLSDRAYWTLRNRILSRKLPPGTPLLEIPIAHELRMSRTPVREAFRRLAQEGLIDLWPRRGAFVRDIPLRRIREIFEIRLLIEPYVTALACGRIPRDRLERIASALRHLTRAGDAAPDEFHGAGDELHALILRAAGNQAMEQCISQFRTEIDRACYFAMQQPGIAQRLCRQHLAIAERLLAGDATGAAAAMAEHIETVRDSVLGSDATRTAPLPVPEGSDPRV